MADKEKPDVLGPRRAALDAALEGKTAKKAAAPQPTPEGQKLLDDQEKARKENSFTGRAMRRIKETLGMEEKKMRSGGMVKARGCGVAQRGKTRGTFR